MVFAWEKFLKNTNGSSDCSCWNEEMILLFSMAGDGHPQFENGELSFYIKSESGFIKVLFSSSEVLVTALNDSYTIKQVEEMAQKVLSFCSVMQARGYLSGDRMIENSELREGVYIWKLINLDSAEPAVKFHRPPKRKIRQQEADQILFMSMETFMAAGTERIAPANMTGPQNTDAKLVTDQNISAQAILRKRGKNASVQTILDALQETSDNLPLLKYIDRKIWTPEILESAVKRCPRDLFLIPQELCSDKLYQIAIQISPEVIRRIPEERRTVDLCLYAVEHDDCIYGDFALAQYVPKNMPKEEKKKIYRKAIEHNGLALAHAQFITADLCRIAVEQTNPDGDDFPIHYVPKRFLTRRLAELSFFLAPCSIRYIPEKYVTFPMGRQVVEQDGRNIQLLPESLQTNTDIMKGALRSTPTAFFEFPDQCKKLLSVEETLPYVSQIENPIMAEPEVSLPAGTRIHDITPEEKDNHTFYYIFDLHLEHQICMSQMTYYDMEKAIRRKINEMVRTINHGDGVLCIGGDVACSPRLWRIFANNLKDLWQGKIIFILGNHELWDGKPEGGQIRPVDDVMEDYRDIADTIGVTLLENEVLLIFPLKTICLDEKEILSYDSKLLEQLCRQASAIVLGGIGFSGRNMMHNADSQLYRDAITSKEDKDRSARFSAIHDKLRRCAEKKKVLVLTHMPPENWMDRTQCVPGWIYVHGHTHHYEYAIEKNGALIIGDNQIGYRPRAWYLKSVSFFQEYDPFEDKKDGKYTVSIDDYRMFHRHKGIPMQMKETDGKILMLKKAGYYFFLFQKEKGLYVLKGGKRFIAEHNVAYYWEHMEDYIRRIVEIYAKYYKSLQKLSEEIMNIGGSGKMHGCIVDIDYYNHAYLNPIDGKITWYFAEDTISKWAYHSLPALLENSPMPPCFPDGSVIKIAEVADDTEMAYVPETEIYRYSQKMLQWQTVLEEKIIRDWDDILLEKNYGISEIGMEGLAINE